MDEPCRMPGCPGHYDDEEIAEALRLPDGSRALVTAIPARVCDFCGDTYLVPTTVAALERLRKAPPPPRATVPHYDLAESPAEVAVAAERAGVSR